MKSTDFAKRIKELTGTGNLDDALATVERLKQGGGAPFGVLLMVDPNRGGEYYARPFGVDALVDWQLLKGSCQHFLMNLDPLLDEMKEQEIRERVRQEMAKEE